MFFDYFVPLHLAMIGIISNPRYRKLEKLLITILIIFDIITIVTFVIGLFRAEVYIYKAYGLVGTLSSIIFLRHRCIGYMMRSEMLDIITRFRNPPPHFTENHIEINTKKELMRTFVPTFKVIFINTLTLAIFPYARILFYKNVDFNDPGMYLIPYLYHFWDVNSFGEFLVLNSMQNLTAGFLCMVYLSFIVIVNYILSNIKAHIEELNEQLNKLIGVNGYDEKKGDNKRDYPTDDQYILLIQYQQYLQKYIKDFTSYMAIVLPMYVIWFIWSAFTLIFASIRAFDDIIFFLQILVVIFNLIYGFFVWCYIGETISRLNVAMLRSFYLTEWYKLPVRIREVMVTSMIHVQAPVKLTVYGIYTLNFSFYVFVLKIVYSIVNILLMKFKT